MKVIYCLLMLMFLFLTISSQAMWSEADCMDRREKVYVAGHTGLVGSAIMRKLRSEGFSSIATRGSKDLDLRDQQAVDYFFRTERPSYVFLAAARVGGIKANMDFPAQFIYDNIAISSNIIHAAYVYGVKKLLFLGSSCIYPRSCPQPIREEYLLTSELEPTNEPYAIAKIAGLKMCQAYNRQYGTKFISCMPTNLYGPHDNFDLKTSHVMPGLIAKICQAQKENRDVVEVWGSGRPRREFLYIEDLADALLHLMRYYQGNEIINIGTGMDITIAELAGLIKDTVNYKGELIFNPAYPDGTPQKLLDMRKLHEHGWHAPTSLEQGISQTVAWYREHV